jgi:hypothetical protein
MHVSAARGLVQAQARYPNNLNPTPEEDSQSLPDGCWLEAGMNPPALPGHEHEWMTGEVTW